jgi:hypothetical protein
VIFDHDAMLKMIALQRLLRLYPEGLAILEFERVLNLVIPLERWEMRTKK